MCEWAYRSKLSKACSCMSTLLFCKYSSITITMPWVGPPMQSSLGSLLPSAQKAHGPRMAVHWTSCAIRGARGRGIGHRWPPGSRGELGSAGCGPGGPTWPQGRWVRWPVTPTGTGAGSFEKKKRKR
jgi:hypothetical protein